jgi:hypothetical protein
MRSAQWLFPNKTLERFDAERKLSAGNRPLCTHRHVGAEDGAAVERHRLNVQALVVDEINSMSQVTRAR